MHANRRVDRGGDEARLLGIEDRSLHLPLAAGVRLELDDELDGDEAVASIRATGDAPKLRTMSLCTGT